jgi:peptidyl-prolyl cis-trans isomerase C
MNFIPSRILVISTASLLALCACNPSNDAKTDKGPAAATVNGVPLSQRTVDMVAKQAASSGRADTPEARADIVQQLALQMVIAEEAVKKGLDKRPEVIDQLDMVRQSVLANAYVQDFIKNNPLSDEALKTEYERIKANISGTEYKARHILVDKEADAKDVIARLRKDPGSFAKLAMEKSKDPGSKARGGELGWFDAKRMVPEFGAAVSKLEKGKFTETPVKTQFGYHVIQLEDSRAIEAPPLEEVKPQLSQQLQQQNWQKHMEALKTAAKIEVASTPTPTPAPPAPAPSAPASAPTK